MNRMALDVVPTGNSATVVGAHDSCIDAVRGDVVSVDVTAEGIPAYSENGTPGFIVDDYGGVIAFQAALIYPESALTVQSENQNFLLAVGAGSTVGNSSQAVPDSDNDDWWTSSGYDTSSPPSIPESGDGVLTRLSIRVDPTAAPGLYALSFDLENTAHLSATGVAHFPNSIFGAYISVSLPCDIDQDGIEDELDACQSIPGPPSNGGCPPPGPPAVGGIVGLSEASDEDWTSQARGPGPASRRLAAAGVGIFLGAVALGTAYALRSRSWRRPG
jgi:hypothetical protein